jgi:hypothetical protein
MSTASGRNGQEATPNLRGIAQDCAARIEEVEFVLGDPVVVAAEGRLDKHQELETCIEPLGERRSKTNAGNTPRSRLGSTAVTRRLSYSSPAPGGAYA